MNNTKRRVSCPQLTKLTLILTLLLGWGSQAWGDIVYFNATSDISGWTKSSINYRSWSDKNLYNNGTNGTLTSTSSISFAKGETLVITAKGYTSSLSTPPQIIVKKSSNNGSSWDDVDTFSYANGDLNLSTGDYKDVIVSGLEGDYQIQLVCNYILISCIKKVASSLPILTISSTNGAFGDITADTSKDYSITNNTGETVTITPSIDGSDMFSVSPSVATDIADGESQIFTISFDWKADASKLGEKTATVTFAPDNGDDPFEISASATAKTKAVFDENETPSYTSGTKSLLIKYTPSSGWNTLCIPIYISSANFSTYMTAIFGSNCKAYQLDSYSDNTLAFTKVTALSSATPYLVYVPSAASHEDGVVFESMYIYDTAAGSTTKGDATFQGTYARKDYAANDDWYGITSEGKVLKAGTGAYVKGYRAYFTGVTPPAGARLTIAIDDDGETTDLGFVKMVDPEAKDVYTLSGQKVQKAGKGIYIVNGRKVVIK